ncbi:MAG: M4 family metallopeptidase, partial [Candidatus Hydrogenedentota bacterium]
MCRESNEVMCHIVPSFMLEAMAQSPDASVRGAALKNIAAAERARTTRATLAEARPQMRSIVPIDASSKLYRVVHDSKLKDNLNGKAVRQEGDPNTGDMEIDEAYRFAGDVHSFYKKVLGRNSLDDHGLTLKSSVRYREYPDHPYNNAFWWRRQMGYGDGDGIVFKRFTASLDVIGHELTHGVVEYTANLVYRSEPGALNESFADVFGSMIKQWRKKQKVDKADWLIGN